jgi:RimJ/RimL family protein N-acetyltransferase
MSAARLRPTLDLPVHGARLRPWQPEDAPTLAEVANDRGIWQNLRDVFPHPYQRVDADSYIRFVTDPASADVHLCMEVDGRAAGAISVLLKTDINRRSAEIGYWLARPQWGRGIGTEAVRILTDYAFTHFDICRLYAEVFAPNSASARVLTKAGFELEGRLRKSVTKDGQTMDALLYAVIR